MVFIVEVRWDQREMLTQSSLSRRTRASHQITLAIAIYSLESIQAKCFLFGGFPLGSTHSLTFLAASFEVKPKKLKSSSSSPAKYPGRILEWLEWC